MLGEMALIDAAPRSASATALEPTALIAVNQARFLNRQSPLDGRFDGLCRARLDWLLAAC